MRLSARADPRPGAAAAGARTRPPRATRSMPRCWPRLSGQEDLAQAALSDRGRGGLGNTMSVRRSTARGSRPNACIDDRDQIRSAERARGAARRRHQGGLGDAIAAAARRCAITARRPASSASSSTISASTTARRVVRDPRLQRLRSKRSCKPGGRHSSARCASGRMGGARPAKGRSRPFFARLRRAITHRGGRGLPPP